MKRDAKYWAERFKLIEQAEHNRGTAAVSDIEKQYREAQRQLEAKLDAWYRRFAQNNQVSMTEAKKMLAGRDLKEFKWDVHEYIRYGEENAINQTWVKELENASARVHISRLEAMKIQMQQQVEVLFGNQLDSIDTAMRDIYLDGYYRTAYEVHKGVGFGWDFGTLDQRRIDKVINKPWAQDGRNFSDRVWSNKQKLVNELNTTLTQNIALGQDPQKAIDAMAKRLNVSKNTAGRLVMTEQAAFCSAAQHDCFKDLDVEEYEIVATLDSHTSEICQEMDGKHFKMSEWETGITAPPFHVWCRSTTVPYFEDDFGEPGERAARGADGKTYMVPANTTYKEWSKAFVDGDKSGLQPVPDSGTVKGKPTTIKTSEEFAKEIDGCSSIDDLNAAATAYFQGKTDCPIELVDLTSCDLDIAKQVVKKVDELESQFKTGMRKLDCHTLGYGIGGQSAPAADTVPAFYNSGDVKDLRFEVTLSEADHNSVKAIRAVFEQARNGRTTVPGEEHNFMLSTIVHEFGHTIMPGKVNELYLKNFPSAKTDYLAFRRLFRTYKRELDSLNRQIANIRAQYAGQPDGLAKGIAAAAALQKEYDDLCISKYSKQSAGEFIAEGFADAILADQPREYSLKVLELLKKLRGKP